MHEKSCGFDGFPSDQEEEKIYSISNKIYCARNLHFLNNFFLHHTTKQYWAIQTIVFHIKWSFIVSFRIEERKKYTVCKLINVNGSSEFLWFAHVLPVISINMKKITWALVRLCLTLVEFLAWTIFKRN